MAKDGTYPWKASADREATGFNWLSRFCTILRRCFVTPGCALFGFAAIYECRRGPGTNLTLRSAIMGFLYTFLCRIITWLTFPLRCAYHILCSLISYNTFIEGYRGQRDASRSLRFTQLGYLSSFCIFTSVYNKWEGAYLLPQPPLGLKHPDYSILMYLCSHVLVGQCPSTRSKPVRLTQGAYHSTRTA